MGRLGGTGKSVVRSMAVREKCRCGRRAAIRGSRSVRVGAERWSARRARERLGAGMGRMALWRSEASAEIDWGRMRACKRDDGGGFVRILDVSESRAGMSEGRSEGSRRSSEGVSVVLFERMMRKAYIQGRRGGRRQLSSHVGTPTQSG